MPFLGNRHRYFQLLYGSRFGVRIEQLLVAIGAEVRLGGGLEYLLPPTASAAVAASLPSSQRIPIRSRFGDSSAALRGSRRTTLHDYDRSHRYRASIAAPRDATDSGI